MKKFHKSPCFLTRLILEHVLSHNGKEYVIFYYYFIIIIIIYLNCKCVSKLWQWYYNKTQHTNTHITQNNTPHSTRSYTNNKGHIAHNEYNAKRSKAMPVTGREGQWSC
jgi:hypothetical protein